MRVRVDQAVKLAHIGQPPVLVGKGSSPVQLLDLIQCRLPGRGPVAVKRRHVPQQTREPVENSPRTTLKSHLVCRRSLPTILPALQKTVSYRPNEVRTVFHSSEYPAAAEMHIPCLSRVSAAARGRPVIPRENILKKVACRQGRIDPCMADQRKQFRTCRQPPIRIAIPFLGIERRDPLLCFIPGQWKLYQAGVLGPHHTAEAIEHPSPFRRKTRNRPWMAAPCFPILSRAGTRYLMSIRIVTSQLICLNNSVSFHIPSNSP
jgi:hypothetical protein